MKNYLLVSILVLSINSHALIDIKRGSENRSEKVIEVGSKTIISGAKDYLNGENVFLGSAYTPANQFSYKMILNSKSDTVYFVDSDQFKNNENEQRVLDLYEQAGGTCSAYAINNFLHQWKLNNSKPETKIAEKLKDEEGRTQILAEAIHEYYLNLKRQYSINGILNGFGKKMGFKCTKASFDNVDALKEMMIEKLDLNVPLLISFNIGPSMYNGPFQIKDYKNLNKEIDQRLWLPRKVGERNSGGHSIVIADYFEYKKKTYLVVIDSDWTEPRLWDLDEVLTLKTAIDEIELITCK